MSIKEGFGIRNNIVSKLILMVGIVFLFSISMWAYLYINYQEKKLMDNVIAGTDRLTNTIRLGTQYAMMLNSRADINQIIKNIGKQPEIVNIRIYNKEGQIKFSNHPAEDGQFTNIKAEACDICHRTEPPRVDLTLDERTRIFESEIGHRLLGIITPVRNDPGCSTGDCHFHPEGKKILGALDVVISLANTDREIIRAERSIVGFSIFVFLVISIFIFAFVLRFVNRPIKKLIDGTKQIAKGDYSSPVEVNQEDEMGQLAVAINHMGREIEAHQAEINKQRDEYQTLFERVPCLITVQDKNYKLLKYNREFEKMFDPKPGDYCYSAYKGRNEKCPSCPVEKTFKTGKSYSSEESGIDKDGRLKYWMVKSSPMRNENGEIIAAMEINLDITERKLLEVELEKSEIKYHAIFNNIPNPVFVLDEDTLDVLDHNESVKTVYGFDDIDCKNRSFLDLFSENEKDHYRGKIKTSTEISQVKHFNKKGEVLFVNIRISPSEYSGRKVLLVTTSDITKRLEAEQQLIQASKMATLGEMATGIAHELNQPLSVIKTASSFLMKKRENQEAVTDEILFNLIAKVDQNVDRAGNIINHMRQFARKSDLEFHIVQLNQVLESAFEIFSQQLKVRGIDVVWQIQEDLPEIKADPGRLEQVFINLLLNARDAIEERCQHGYFGNEDKKIILKTALSGNAVICEVCDTGIGIPEGLINKIFEPFYTTKEVGKGTGLGLSISYGIVKDCGGSIEVYPNTDLGTCFRVKFPLSENVHESKEK